MATPVRHDCKPLWITGSIRATCRPHWWKALGWQPRVTPPAAAKGGVR